MINTPIKLGAVLFTIGVSTLVFAIVILNDTGHSGFDLTGGSLPIMLGAILFGVSCMIVGWVEKG